LIVYRRSVGEIVQLEDLGTDRKQAMRHRFEAEHRHKGDPDLEVVVLSAPSREVLERTHARYFRSSRQLTEDLRAALSK
jgi:hypothetical protein